MIFSRIKNCPFIPRTAGTFYSRLVANPDVVEFKDNLYYFFRGHGDSGHDQIGVWTKPAADADGFDWDKSFAEPVIPVSEDKGAVDSDHILDPAAIVFNGSLHVYYTSKSSSREPDYSISLAVSPDGEHYEKHGRNPVLAGAIAPEVVFHRGKLHLFFQRHKRAGNFWEVFCRTSEDGLDFAQAGESKVFGPTRKKGDFDGHSVTTVRIFQEGDWFYMTYGACRKFLDYPESIGLARSQDLHRWERYPGNPIFARGQEGEWDEGALWYPTVYKLRGQYLMWYEGAGAGLGNTTEEARRASRIAREDYGGYLDINFSQIGVAVGQGRLPDW